MGIKSLQTLVDPTIADRIISTSRAVLLRFSLGDSCGIPLSVVSSSPIEILTWTFMGFDSQSVEDPSCVLILGRSGGGPIHLDDSFTVRMHVRDLHLIPSGSARSALSKAESMLLAQTVVTALTSATVDPLASLLPSFSTALDTLTSEPICPELRVDHRSGNFVVEGLDFIPAFILTRTSSVYACAPVVSVRARATPGRAMQLKLDSRFDAAAVVDRAIFVGEGRYAVADRLRRG